MPLPLLIPAAGLGSRLFPATWGVPKELFPLGNKPALHYILEEAHHAHMINISFIIAPYKEAIIRYCQYSHAQQGLMLTSEERSRLHSLHVLNQALKYAFVIQKSPLGVGNAMNQASHILDNQDFFAMAYPDDVIVMEGEGLAKLIEVHKQYKCSVIAIQKVPREKASLYGIIEGEECEKGIFKIFNIIEKPHSTKDSFAYAIVGRYILSHQIFHFLDNNSECFITSLLAFLAAGGSVIGAVIHEDARLDIGTVQGWYDAIHKIYSLDAGMQKSCMHAIQKSSHICFID